MGRGGGRTDPKLTQIGVVAIQDRLVTSLVFANRSQGLNDAQAYLFPLKGLVHRNVLDMSNAP